MPPEQSAVRNRLLVLLAQADFERLAPHLEPVDLPRGFQIAAPHQLPSHHYFMDAGISSIVAISPEGHKAEVGLVGRDGVVPTTAILQSDTTPHEIFVQVAGRGHRVETAVLAQALDENAALRRLTLRFVQSLSVQTGYTALSNTMHHVEERLARWILMCHDRVDGTQVELTHDFIALMLGVRRPSVTTALHILEGNKLIYSERGLVTIRDRRELEAFAADAYGIPEKEYARLIGPMKA
jgi:CRP-like cAMP-binding protein